MYVKSLTLRGFKSFASATSLRFEPGITCVVGPNGSGKSNIVDAFAWVMGEQGVKSLRGGKMDDVVFAGTASRAPLGRAEAVLTIDNSDGALPIDYTEVTISRLLFRSGQSEYAINGNHCRLLDVAELLSDSGLGREMHVIVGQGQLDEVLHAGPEARRALIEEAAGVLKHRRRKEKALRKLEAMQANLTRLVDLTAELRRRLGPLGRQAAIARRAAAIQADLRDARLRLLADDYTTQASELERGEADEAAVAARRGELEQSLAQARQRESALDASEQELAPQLEKALQAWFALSSLAERLRGVSNLARERHSHLVSEPAPERAGRDPDELDAEAASLREQEAVLGDRLETARQGLATATRKRETAEVGLAAAEKMLAARAQAAAERAELLARLRGQVGAARSRVAAAEEEAGRLADACEQARSRAVAAQEAYEEHQERATGRQGDRANLATEHKRVAAALAAASALVTERRAAERRASAERAAMLARTQALEEGIRALQQGADAQGALLTDPRWSDQVLGAVTGLLTVADGAQEAITAALGAAADAIAVVGLDAAVRFLRELKDSDAGVAGLVVAAEAGTGDAAGPALSGGGEKLPPGVLPALDLLDGPGELSAPLAGLLGDVVVAGDLTQALQVVRTRPELRVVTRDGDLLGAHWAHGGSARPPSVLAMRAAADDAAAGLGAAESACETAAAELAASVSREEQAREAVGRAQAALQTVDKAAAEFSGQVGRLAGEARAAQQEAARLEAAIASAHRQRERDLAALSELNAQLAAEEEDGEAAGHGVGSGPAARSQRAARVEAAEEAAEPAGAGTAEPAGAGTAEAAETGELEPADYGQPGQADYGQPGQADSGQPGQADSEAGEPDREALSAAAVAARDAEMEARLEVRTAEERLRAIAGRADALALAAAGERRAAAAAQARRRLRQQQAEVAMAVVRGADIALERVAESLSRAAVEREAAEQASRGRAEALKEVRAQVRSLAEELDGVVESAHGAEIAHAEHRMRLEQIAGRAAEEFSVDSATLVAEYGPDVPITAPPQPETGDGGKGGKGATASTNGGAPKDGGAAKNGSIPAKNGGGEDPAREPTRYVRAEQERRAATAQRQLNQLGKVNPLALEEYAALEERHTFLANQLEDLKKTRRDLLTVIKEVDDRVQQVFTSAFEDTAAQFEQIFARLFPGGEGRLVLTEPDDMLATGIDVEARPPGKKVKRLSLLSGGERSLTAIAYLLAIFMARPSPFYVLDEVEAALDDTNLQRLLQIFEELRDSSQLIIVTHQKRTMEVADALYGISMRGDGVSAVVSQRLRERERA